MRRFVGRSGRRCGLPHASAELRRLGTLQTSQFRLAPLYRDAIYYAVVAFCLRLHIIS